MYRPIFKWCFHKHIFKGNENVLKHRGKLDHLVLKTIYKENVLHGLKWISSAKYICPETYLFSKIKDSIHSTDLSSLWNN